MRDTQADLSRISKKLFIKKPFYGMLFIGLNKVITKKLATAGIGKNGINAVLYINPDFWWSLDDEERISLVEHEVLHLANFHPLMRNHLPNHRMANIAHDCEINQYIHTRLPKGAIFPETIGLDSNEHAKKGSRFYYSHLRKLGEDKMREMLGGNPSEGEAFGENGQGGASDSGQTPGQPGGGTETDGTPGTDEQKASNDKGFRGMNQNERTQDSHSVWKEFDELSDGEKESVKRAIEQQIMSAYDSLDEKGRGTVPGHFRKFIEDLQRRKPIVDWRGFVKRFMGSSSEKFPKLSRRKPSKRFPGAMGIRRKRRRSILLVWDTSASVNNDELSRFLSITDNLHRAGVRITVVECDTQIRPEGIYKYKPGMTREDLVGGGGTTFDGPINYLNDNLNKFNCIIYLTDGEAPPPRSRPLKPILWVITEDGHSVSRMRNMGFEGGIVKMTKDD